jgi:glycosyltransferase involved in cell wall biosynthesis
MAAVTPPPARRRAPLASPRDLASSLLRGVTAALDTGLSGGAAEVPFLSRLLLRTDQQDIDRLNEIRRWFRPDVEYACDLALVPLMARLEDLGIPLIAAAQGFEIVYRRGVGLLDALRASRPRLDLILSGSQANIQDNLAELNEAVGDDVPARAIPYGVGLDGGWEMPREAARRRLNDLSRHLSPSQAGSGGLWGSEREQPFVITCFSRIDVEKGTDLPLHALAILRSQGVPARLWIAGNTMPGSAFLEVVRSKIRLMDLQGHVSLIGTLGDVRDKIALLRASDAFVAGFIRSEPFGLVYTEAFASELPVVAPDSGAAPELMRAAGETGTLYPPNDTGAMAACLKRLYQDQDLRRRLASGQRRAFLERFNATAMARAAAEEFERAVKARLGRPHAEQR